MLKKKITTVFAASVILLSIASTTIAAEGKDIDITEEKIHLYPTFSSFTTEFASSSNVNNIVPLAEDENAITVSLTGTSDGEIYFVSVYDITEERYVTSSRGVPIAKEQFIAKGLVGGHDYKIRASSLFSEAIVSGKISTGCINSAQTDGDTLIQTADNSVALDQAVSELKSFGIVKGYEDGSFRAENKITRAEAAAMINRTIVQKNGSVSSVNALNFSDVERGTWFYAGVLKACDFGIINGYDDGTFRPQNDITYQEFIKMLVSMLFCEEYAEDGGYPQGYIAAAKELGITQDIAFTATDKISRGDAAIMLRNTINTPFLLTEVFDENNGNEYSQAALTYKDILSEI